MTVTAGADRSPSFPLSLSLSLILLLPNGQQSKLSELRRKKEECGEGSAKKSQHELDAAEVSTKANGPHVVLVRSEAPPLPIALLAILIMMAATVTGQNAKWPPFLLSDVTCRDCV